MSEEIVEAQQRQWGEIVDQMKAHNYNPDLIARIDGGFLEFIFTTQRIVPPIFLEKDGMPTFLWELSCGFICVSFDTQSTTWQWEAEIEDGSDGCGKYKSRYDFKGAESWSFDSSNGTGKHYGYCLPNIIEKHFVLPDTFSQAYTPQLDTNYRKPKIMWSTGYWDGPLSGYCEYNDQLCYFDLIEETDYERHRMYAVYELSSHEQIDAWCDHYSWTSLHTSRGRYALWLKWWQFKNRFKYRFKNLFKPVDTFEIHKEKREQFRKSHKLLGYFKG